MNNQITSEAEATLGRAISQCLASGHLAGAIPNRGYIERAMEPVALAVFNLAAAGQPPEISPILDRLGLTGGPREWGAITLDREIESGESKRLVFAGLLVLDRGMVTAAAFRASWNTFERQHDDDLGPAGQSMTVRKVAKHMARRGSAVFGFPINAAEAAWATMQGYGMAGIRLSRDAWTSALQGALSGAEEFQAEAAYRAFDKLEAWSRVDDLLQGAAA